MSRRVFLSSDRMGEVVVAVPGFFIVFAVIFVLAFLMIAGTSGFVFFNVFRIFNRVLKNVENVSDSAKDGEGEKKRRALDVLSKQPPGTPACKCRNCGATVDSTAELAADGRVRCNYCNEWSSIYQ